MPRIFDQIWTKTQQKTTKLTANRENSPKSTSSPTTQALQARSNGKKSIKKSHQKGAGQEQ